MTDYYYTKDLKDSELIKVKSSNEIFYYIDTSVLLENIHVPLVKFIKTISGTQVVIFHNLTREFIDDFIDIKFVS